MTARERLAKLFDEGSFTEMGQFIHHRGTHFGMQEKEIPGDGVVTGYGTVRGRLVFAYAEDFTVEGGSLGEMHAHKIAQMQEMALKMGAPVIGINDSGGARIQEGIDALSGFGRIFMNNTSASGVIPQLAVIMGPCAGGAVYSPALMDFVFMVKNTSDMFLTGPAVIKSVTAEEVTAEELGGAMTHSSISGVAHFACENEDDCIEKIKALLDFLPSNNMEEAPVVESDDDPNREDESLNSVIPDDSSMPYDMLDVIKSCVDDAMSSRSWKTMPSISSPASPALTARPSVSSPTSRNSLPAAWISTHRTRRLVSSASATASISLSSPSSMYRASCLGRLRNTAASSARCQNALRVL